MKILFVAVNREKRPIPVIPYGMCWVAAALREKGHEVEACDLMFAEDPRQELSRVIKGFNPQLIGVSIRNTDNQDFHDQKCYGPEIKEVIDCCKEVTDAPMVLGGPGFSSKPEAMLRYLGLDIGIVGDGEWAMGEVVGKINSPRDIAGIPGVAMLTDGKFYYQPARLIERLDNLPSPAVDLIDYKKYQANTGVGSVQTKRGCSFNCLYCQILDYHGHAERLRSPGRIADDIETLIKEYGINYLYFTDNLFNHPRKHAEDICQELLRRKLEVQWSSYFHPRFIDRQFIQLIKGCGCAEILFNTGTITRVEKDEPGVDLECLRQSISICQAEGLKFTHFIFFGAPGDDLATLERIFEIMEEVEEPSQFFILYSMPVFPGARIFDLAREEGIISGITAEPTFYTPSIVDEAIKDYIHQSCEKHTNWFYTLKGADYLLRNQG